ncbi:DUF6332 family protein [Streptomyces sp. AK02-01A]|uniref:DUF6332 family protein n=1 Tax=Streptomyces sp. AK02-01A TaxID=3028648 RepID=UPI0029A6140F|nr:DUF6332 family protein [Streptomyces sp. AK02-01A]MDX3853874.1 DUF6332 family protein [Streptomyces sp. AK02-01A]
MGSRSGAERDAITVEIGYAVLTAAFAAGLVYGVIAGSARYFELPRVVGHVGAVAACLTFVARVVHVLWRFPRRSGRPSRPGRTRPDS